MRWSPGALGVATVMAAMAAVASGGDDGSAPPPLPPVRGVRILSGAEVTDSAGARLLQPLIVEVRNSAGALSTSAVARYTIQATVGPLSRTAQFSVVPPGC